ncbi:MAG: FAD-dependent thymidylate synthase [Armatimonadia bacterium]|nr:FAD-dependent thymidylate synthase [Armatimonadia bacterium]
MKPQVRLVQHTERPDEVIAAAARLCYAESTDGLLDEASPEDAAALVRRLNAMGHHSPLEHASFTFYLEGVSRVLTHQLVRHRIASYSQRSQRYVAHDRFDYVVPPQLEGRTVEVDGEQVDAVDYFHQTMGTIAEHYAALNDALGRTGERSNEDARYVLPNACETKIFVTMNARELLHFFGERLCRRAQWEIRKVADMMLAAARPVAPAALQNAGPKCVRLGGCPEGRMTCGRYAQMVQRYGEVKGEK